MRTEAVLLIAAVSGQHQHLHGSVSQRWDHATPIDNNGPKQKTTTTTMRKTITTTTTTEGEHANDNMERRANQTLANQAF